ncbi:unnamed protein product [Chironomus riparius]|uniref:Uncharacterized protein n=1 Tax=Chironomus riparius TaxID=315576 RepID=A0A9N9WPJ8_9DIPT|nr:unnamed protein product [Chironomus riparius]
MMNGMNFFNLNSANPTSALFGTGNSSSASLYKDSCKYGSSAQNEEEEDSERLLNDGSTHVHKTDSSNTHSFNERSTENISHIVQDFVT